MGDWHTMTYVRRSKHPVLPIVSLRFCLWILCACIVSCLTFPPARAQVTEITIARNDTFLDTDYDDDDDDVGDSQEEDSQESDEEESVTTVASPSLPGSTKDDPPTTTETERRDSTIADSLPSDSPLPCGGQCFQGYCDLTTCVCGDVFLGTYCEFAQLHLATQYVGTTSIQLRWDNLTLNLGDFVALVYMESSNKAHTIKGVNILTTDNTTFTVPGLTENGKAHLVCMEHYSVADDTRAILQDGPDLAMKQRCIWVETEYSKSLFIAGFVCLILIGCLVVGIFFFQKGCPFFHNVTDWRSTIRSPHERKTNEVAAGMVRDVVPHPERRPQKDSRLHGQVNFALEADEKEGDSMA